MTILDFRVKLKQKISKWKDKKVPTTVLENVVLITQETHIYIYIYVCVCVRVCVRVRVFMCMCMCMCVSVAYATLDERNDERI